MSNYFQCSVLCCQSVFNKTSHGFTASLRFAWQKDPSRDAIRWYTAYENVLQLPASTIWAWNWDLIGSEVLPLPHLRHYADVCFVGRLSSGLLLIFILWSISISILKICLTLSPCLDYCQTLQFGKLVVVGAMLLLLASIHVRPCSRCINSSRVWKLHQASIKLYGKGLSACTAQTVLMFAWSLTLTQGIYLAWAHLSAPVRWPRPNLPSWFTETIWKSSMVHGSALLKKFLTKWLASVLTRWMSPRRISPG